MKPLRELRVRSLRGSTSELCLPFEQGKRITIVYGENGSGKSTICDALDFLGNGRIGSLDDWGLRQTTVYWPSLGKTLADVHVELVDADGACGAQVGPGGAVVARPLESRPIVEIFRRRQILGPIEAQPAERYKEIERFVDVSAVERSEGSLRDLIRELKQQQNDSARRVRENQDEIERYWSTAGRPGTDALAWAEGEVSRDPSSVRASADSIDALHIAYMQLEKRAEALSAATASNATAVAHSANAAQHLRERLAGIAAGAAEMVALLQGAQSYIEQFPSPDLCPLCESTERVEGLGPRVQARLSEFQSLVDAQRAAALASQAETRASDRLLIEREGAARDVAAFETARSAPQLPSSVPLPAQTPQAELAQLEIWLSSTGATVSSWAVERDRLRTGVQAQASVRGALSNLKSNRRTAEELEALIPRLTAVHTAVVAERRAFTDEALGEISDEVGRLYEEVHPGEGLDKIALELDPKRRASLEIGAQFQGRDAKPQAYFSDSHLDTLGLCILLALSLRDRPERKILVLDDVLASADEPHVERLVELLYTQGSKFRHCIITTHYRPWKEKLRWGLLKTRECHFVELARWSFVKGIGLSGSVPEIERLRALLAAPHPDLQSLCAKAGVVLEALLDFLTFKFECRVPRREGGRLTAGDLLDSVNFKLRGALRAEVKTGVASGGIAEYQSVELGPILDELKQIVQARNLIGCHFTEVSFALPDSDALRFGALVLRLADAVVDVDDGWPKSDKSGSYWSTSSESRRLHPLQQPN